MSLERLLERAASGSCVAQCTLGLHYLVGHEDIGQDYRKAFEFLSQAAEQGASRAIWGLAHIYANGLAVEKDTAKAVKLYTRAAARGEFFAQLELARIYAKGDGIPRDDLAAFVWYSVVAAHEGDVEDAELQEARQFVADWKKNK